MHFLASCALFVSPPAKVGGQVGCGTMAANKKRYMGHLHQVRRQEQSDASGGKDKTIQRGRGCQAAAGEPCDLGQWPSPRDSRVVTPIA